jgi:tetratricopeptide (TPR) repeat protein
VIKNDLPAAEALLIAAQQKYPKQSAPWDTLSDIYMNQGQTTNAVEVLERQLKAQPDSNRALVNYAVMKINQGQPQQALPYLEKALRLKPGDEHALLNRAIAYLKMEQLDAAERDLTLLYSSTRPIYKIRILYHLADVAWRKKKPKDALRYYKELINDIPAGTSEGQMFRERIKVLEGGSAF